jgi:hypothetical protein
MSKDLTNSGIDRKNILNNDIAIQEVYKQMGFYGIQFEGKYRFTKQQLAQYFEVDSRTIERIVEANKEELEQNGYEIFAGEKLRRFKEEIADYIKNANDKLDVPDTNVENISQLYKKEIGNWSKAPQLSIFTYKTFLNIGMLLTNSENAQKLRSAILDIVIDVLNKRIGGKTKYINQREEDFLSSAIREYNYRKDFTNALFMYIEDNTFKYALITDKIYKSIFKENIKEYKQILKLKPNESSRSTMYSEVLDLIAGYENGFAKFLENKFHKKGGQLNLSEAISLFSDYESITEATLLPLREKARSLMVSRDLAFRDALHEKLEEYVHAVSADDYEKFLGERSMDLEMRIEENEDVFKRLKNR